MKQLFLCFVAILSFQFTAQAQLPNMNKLKNKAKSSLKKGEKKEEAKASSSSNSSSSSNATTEKKEDKNADGRPKYDPNSQIYRAYSIVRDEIRSSRSQLKDINWKQNVEGRNADVVKYLARAKENLDKLKADPNEAGKPYIANFEKEWNEVEAQRKEMWESYSLDKEYDNKLEQYYKFAIMGWEIHDESLEPSYKGYYKLRDEFKEKRPEKYQSSYVQSRVQKVDNFFQVEVYEIIPRLTKDVEKAINNVYKKNSSGEEWYKLNAKNCLKEFDDPEATIKLYKKVYMEKTEEIDALQAKIDKEKAMLNEYISSGKYDAHVAKYRQQIIDAVRLGKPMMSNSTYSSLAKKGVDKGTVNRVVITNSTWIVKKNDYGFPLYKYLPVDIAVTDADGKCWLAYGQIRKSYEGGGVYGGEYFNYWGKQEEMNCANINK